jgi:RNA polymerase sigma factor for flagellar operon FliA
VAGVEPGSRNAADWLPLIRKQANRLFGRLPANIEYDDLIQAGSLGLLDAFRLFDGAAGASFETFANHRVAGAMLDELRRGDWLSRTDRRLHSRLLEAARCLQQELGREPLKAELAKRLGLELEEVQRAWGRLSQASLVPLEDLGDLDGMASSVDTETPEAALERRQASELLAGILGDLSKRDRDLLSTVYLEEVPAARLARAGQLSSSRISQRVYAALANARKAAERRRPALTPQTVAAPETEDVADWMRRNLRGVGVTAHFPSVLG